MASQQPRPPWFRFPAIGNRPPAPAPNPASPPPPQPVPVRPPLTRPTIPIMPPVVPTQTQEPMRPPPTDAAPPQSPPVPPSSPISTPPLAAAPPRSPIVTTVPETDPERSPSANPPVQVATIPRSPIIPSENAAPPPSPPAQDEARLNSPVVPPASQPTPPSVTATILPSQTPPAPSPTIAPHATSPVPKAPITSSRNVLLSSSSTSASPKITAKSPSSSMQTSPVARPVESPAAISATEGPKAATPVPSPKTVKPLERTPAQSPKNNPSSDPPSPFTLPPAQDPEDENERKFPAEVEQKTVLVQETIEKPTQMTNSHTKGIDSNGRTDHMMNSNGTSKNNSDSEELGMKLITLAGENKGAIMELSPQKQNYPSGNPQRLFKNKNNHIGSNLDQSSSDSGEEGKSNKEGKTSSEMAKQPSPTTVFLNSNVQGANNSILHNCNHRHNDPGVHLSLTKKVNGSREKDHRGKCSLKGL